MSSTNIYGQLNLMYQRVHAVQQGLNILSLAFKERADALEHDKKLLCEKAIQVRKAMHALSKGKSRTAGLGNEIRQLRGEISAAQSNPVIKKYMNMVDRNASFRHRSPSSTFHHFDICTYC
jgi:hypothetical protein